MSVNGVKVTNFQRPVNLMEIASRGNQAERSAKTPKSSFKEMFSEHLAENRGVNFSKHASQRLFSRGIELSDVELNKVARAVDQAEAKGSKETLLLADDYALVVSIKDRTVVTAFDRDNLRDGVVTAIDSAVLL